MKRWCCFFSLFILAVFGSFISYVYYYKAEFTSHELTKLSGHKVQVASMQLSFDEITLYGLEILSNQPSQENLFSAKKISVIITPFEIAKAFFGMSTAHIKVLRIEGPEFSLACVGDFWNQFLDSFVARKSSAPSHGRTFIIEQLELVSFHPKRSLTLNFSKHQPFDLQDIIHEVLKTRGTFYEQPDSSSTAT